MSWLVLSVPATFAEVIGLSLKRPGSWGYVNNQIFTGLMYIGAFICGKFDVQRSSPTPNEGRGDRNDNQTRLTTPARLASSRLEGSR